MPKGDRVEGFLYGFFLLWIYGDNLQKAFKTLTETEAGVLKLRFGMTEERKPHTQRQVGKILNLSNARIGQIEAKALRKLSWPGRMRNFAIQERKDIFHIFTNRLVEEYQEKR